ncbi:flagellar hook-length control protein FliK [Ruegeria atlantica]|uniref:flagellar hook-length control protein FliK n=1 Tax=Ruegeria atlantica TaxID=81569 RepID=UPI0024951AA0|nr:flagellar hook-length control protein FliK [Ruegeria atlantica]
MPNPLSVMSSSPTATAKPHGINPEQGDENGATFEAVLNQHKGENKEEAAALKGAEPEQDVDVETDEAVLLEDAEVSADRNQSERTPLLDTRLEVSTKRDPAETPVSAALPDSRSPKVPETEQTGQANTVDKPDAGINDSRKVTPDFRHSSALRPASQPMATRGQADLATSVFQPVGISPKETADLTVHPERHQRETQRPPQSNLAPQQTTNPDRAPSIAQLQMFAPEKTRAQTDAPAFHEVEDVHALRADSPVSAGRDSVSSAQVMAQTARSETARAVAGQMAAVINTQPKSGSVEIALNPEELGRVSIMLNGRDDGLHLTISAERPETLEMMRRHLAVLEEEFKNFGLGDLSFDLGTSEDADQNQAGHQDGSPAETAKLTASSSNASPIPKTGPVGRIDMRL